jgi:hypothetical protein
MWHINIFIRVDMCFDFIICPSTLIIHHLKSKLQTAPAMEIGVYYSQI